MSFSEKRPILSNLALSEETKKKYLYVVGIDFGTTYSGVAYSKVGEVDGRNNQPIITEINRWPAGNIGVLTQAPSVSVYNSRGVLQKWGFQSTTPGRPPLPGNTTISMFKLHLDESNAVNIPPLPPGVTAIQAISDYLRAIYEYSFTMMTRSLGNTLEKSTLRFCLTVPAVWTEEAKITMREAAIQAGIVSESDPQDRLLLVGEPEAAALYCETFLEQYNLKENDTFLICDAGGGTVDLVLYRVSIEEDGSRSLIEEVAGDGGMCGSVTLDLRFKEMIESIFAQLEGVVEPLTDSDLDGITRKFAESLKFITYDETAQDFDAEAISVELPPRYYGTERFQVSERVVLEDGNLLVSPYEIRDRVFTPVIDQVLDLVRSQVEKVHKLNAIFLVGGFGSSPMLYSKLRSTFSQVDLVCTPGRAEMAIVRGAVLMGINPRYVKQRVVRRTYGYECAVKFERGLDPEYLKAMTDDGDLYCNKRFVQYAVKGEIKDVDYYAETKFHSYYHGKPKLSLYAYDGDTDKIPRHTTDKHVKKIVDFQIDMPEPPTDDPKGFAEFIIRFYLYQTEIKVQVEVEGHVKIYTGSYKKKFIPLLGSVNSASDLNLAALNIRDNPEARFGLQSIETSYEEESQPAVEPEDDEELGLQVDIVSN